MMLNDDDDDDNDDDEYDDVRDCHEADSQYGDGGIDGRDDDYHGIEHDSIVLVISWQ